MSIVKRPNRNVIRVGLIKAVPVKWDLEANWRQFVSLAKKAADAGADMVCTPECFLDGYVTTDPDWSPKRFKDICIGLDESYLLKARRLAKSLRLHMVFGFTQKAAEGAYNAAALIDDAGGILGIYNKTHLQQHDKRYLPGRDLPVFDTRLGKIGIMICADRRWPEVPRVLRVKGAEIIMNPTYGMWHIENEWWMRTRSYENEVYVCFAHPNVAFVAGPSGEIAAKLQTDEPDALIHDLDLGRNGHSMLDDRRPELYKALSEPIHSS